MKVKIYDNSEKSAGTGDVGTRRPCREKVKRLYVTVLFVPVPIVPIKK